MRDLEWKKSADSSLPLAIGLALALGWLLFSGSGALAAGPARDDERWLTRQKVWWMAHKWQLLTVGVCVTEGLLIAGLLAERARRRRSEARYRCIVQDQTELICRFLPDGTYTFVNAAYCRYFQRSPEELLGRTFWSFIPEEARDVARQTLASVTPDHPVATCEHEVVAPGGEIRWQQWSDRGFFDDRGQVVEYQSVGRDITERMRAEEEHRQLEAQKQMAAALREADRRKDEFLAMVSHELRNPLTPMTMSLQVMRGRDIADPDLRWAREVMGRQVEQLNRLVNDLLDISRITSGKVNLQLKPLDLRQVATQAVESIRPHLNVRGHHLSQELGATPLMVQGDAVRLIQVVSNLLHNAVKYTGGVGTLRLRAEHRGADIVLTMSDSGVGIPADMIERVFEPFVQLGETADGAPEGLGLGLALVKRLVEAHGGQVQARSPGAGKGSEFVVTLPALAGAAVAEFAYASVTPPLAETVASRRRILVVDDNVDAAVSLARVLQLQKHEVQVAHDGPTALRAAERGDPEVVLLDIGMPGMDGLQVARRLRERAGGSLPLLVAMTGYGRREDRRKTAEAGFDHHLVKPVNVAVLGALISTISQRNIRS